MGYIKMNFPKPWSFEFNGFEYDTNHKVDFSNQLKRLRKLHGISCEKLANEIHTAKCTIVNYENKNNRPNLETACRIAVFFGVTLDELVFGHIPNGISINTKVRKNETPKRKSV